MTHEVKLPEVIPLCMQDIEIMRCTTCGAIVPGIWRLTRKTMAVGINHVLDEHRPELIAGQLSPPLFVNCMIQDPFWFDEHGGV